MTLRLSRACFCALFAAGLTLAAHGATTTTRVTADYGSFQVLARVGGDWQSAGELSFGRAVGLASLKLPGAISEEAEIRVRLVQHGGGAAFIDAVNLDGRPPLEVIGLAEDNAEALVARRDDDLVDALGRTIELVFPSGSDEGNLQLSARVEGPVIYGAPFSFPPANLFRGIDADSQFYRYQLRDSDRAPDWPATLDAGSALFAERCQPTTGHPEGTTYGWVANDEQTLYAAVEFTPDNTRDGTKDWSSLWVRRNGATREFRVSEADTTWGRPDFLSTGRAAYRHKLYTFEVPLREIGITDVAEAGELDLAFEAYGTASVSIVVDPSLWDFGPILVGDTASSHMFTVMSGPNNVILSTPWFSRGGPDSAAFPLSPGTCSDGLSLQPGQWCTFYVGFAPDAVGSFQDNITITATIVGDGLIGTTARVLGNGIEPIPVVGGRAIALLIGALLVLGVFLVRRLR